MARFLLRRDPLACFLVSTFVLVAILAPLLQTHSPNAIDLSRSLESPSFDHWLGTDELGRDLLSRIVGSTRVALTASLFVVAIGATIGTILGTLAGGLGGTLDLVVSRLVETLQGFPVVLLAIAIVAIAEPSLSSAMLAVGVALIPGFARVSRGIALQLKHREFVEAARSAGASEFRILRREVLPNMAGPLIVLASFDIGAAILYEASLSFLGLGVQPPTASFGGMLSDAKGYLYDQPLYALFPGIAVALVILGLNLLGDALGDYYQERPE
jgi:peptide/nickel transport system permease protein